MLPRVPVLRTIPLSLLSLLLSAVSVKAGLTDGLVAYWDFHEGTGNIVHDVSGHGNHGLNSGGSWVGSQCPYALEILDTDLVWQIPSAWDDAIEEALTVAAWVLWYGPNNYGTSIVLDGRHAYWGG